MKKIIPLLAVLLFVSGCFDKSSGGKNNGAKIKKWGEETLYQENSSNSSVPKVAMDDEGETILIWKQERSQSSDIQVHSRVYLDKQWREETIVGEGTDIESIYHPRISISQNGKGIVAWKNGNNIYARLFQDGRWSENPIKLNADCGFSDAIATAIDDSGDAIVTWYQSGAGAYRIFKAEYRGGNWVVPSNCSDFFSIDGGGNAYAPDVAMDNNGNAILVWQQSVSSGDDDMSIFKAEYREGSWLHPSLDEYLNITNKSSRMAKVAMGDNGDAVIVWKQDDGSKIYKAEMRHGRWSLPVGIKDLLNPPRNGYGDTPSVAMNSKGDTVVVWYQTWGSSGQIAKAEYRDGNWSIFTDFSGVVNDYWEGGNCRRYPAVAINDTGYSLITWLQKDAGRVVQVYKSEYIQGQWQREEGAEASLSHGLTDAGHVDVALSQQNDAIIVWDQDQKIMGVEKR